MKRTTEKLVIVSTVFTLLIGLLSLAACGMVGYMVYLVIVKLSQ